ncbi:MAG: UDP-N-acetylmuramoyl-L-alanine--D-glutamate ligase [Yoonia sp.]
MVNLPDTILVWGLGVESTALFRFLTRVSWGGTCLIYADGGGLSQSDLRDDYPTLNLTVLDDAGLADALETVTLVARSPGVSIYRDELVAFAKRDGCRTATSTSIALGMLNLNNSIGVTGTKGKSSTSTMLRDMLADGENDVVLAGNIGRPLIDYLPLENADTRFVIELSSYQTSDIVDFPNVAIMLNLYADHLDWHHGVKNYQADKLRLINNDQTAWCAVNAALRGSDLVTTLADIAWFNAPDAIHFADGQFHVDGVTYDGTALLNRLGSHMMENACAALTVAQHFGIDVDTALARLSRFEALNHRQQVLDVGETVTFVDDSISTTPESTMAALDRFAHDRLHLIVGGADRGVDYDALITRLWSADIASVTLVGEVGQRLNLAFAAMRDAGGHSHAAIVFADTLEAAVADLALQSGDTVLLSPAASSYDQFKNFEQRGRAFEQYAKQRGL